ncbi:hypothetical protein [Streptomyces anulatus]|uniref:hypothetical protein n=1 Tax=Streptomyces anulatus TaxID=1892 RepID=UPI0033F1496A|nr:hypothetical protein OG238_30910 [Streptomyces anulatus]
MPRAVLEEVAPKHSGRLKAVELSADQTPYTTPNMRLPGREGAQPDLAGPAASVAGQAPRLPGRVQRVRAGGCRTTLVYRRGHGQLPAGMAHSRPT